MSPRDARRVGFVAGVALGVGVTVAGLVYAAFAVPLYVFDGEAGAADRATLHDVLLLVALPAGVVSGLALGALAARWQRRTAGSQRPGSVPPS